MSQHNLLSWLVGFWIIFGGVGSAAGGDQAIGPGSEAGGRLSSNPAGTPELIRCCGDVLPFRDYTDVPGVTEAEIESIERLRRARPEGLTYAMIASDATFIALDGEVGGVTRIFCKELSRLFGLRINPRLVNWDVLVAGLDRRDFDLSGELTATPERRAKYHMSGPIMDREFTVFHRADRPDLDLINGRGTLRCGFLKGSVTADRVRATAAVPLVAVDMANIAEATEALHSGDIDAFISEGRAGSFFEDDAGITSQLYYPLLYTSVSLATADPELAPLIDVFQKYLDNGGRARMSEIRAEGEVEYLRHKFIGQIGVEERKRLAGHLVRGEVIRLLAEHDNYPVSFYNRREKQWQGIAHDILAEISRVTRLRFEIVNEPGTPWLELQQTLESGGADMVTELMPSQNRRGRFLWTREPYVTDNYALLSLDSTPDLKVNQVFGARVGVIRGTAHEEAFARVFPDHSDTVAYANAGDGFAALEKGEVDLVMMTENLLLSVTHYQERPGFKVNIPLKAPSDSYFGFNINEEVLRGLVEEGQALVDCGAIAERWQRQTFDYRQKIAQARLPYLIGISALLLVVLGLLLALSQKKARLSRRLSRIDHLTGLPNRRFFEERLSAAWDLAVRGRRPLSVLSLDIDRFKRLNDTYGHPQGDEALRVMARVIGGATGRRTDLAARLGGEEFAVLLPDTDLDGAQLVAEKMRAAVEAAEIENLAGGPVLRITVSIGVASLKPGLDDRQDEFLARSDQALYAAKESGRNRVCVVSG